MTLYSANNTPYSAMTAVMTSDVNERTSLSTYRFVSAMIAQLIVGTFTLPLVLKFGQGDSAKGWQITIGIWTLICIVCFIVTFLTTRERIQPPPQQKSNEKEDFGNLLKNGPWIAMFIVTIAHFINISMRGGTVLYYFQYYVDTDSLYTFLQGFGLAASADSGGFWYSLLDTFGLLIDDTHSNVSSVGFSMLNMTSLLITVIGVAFSTYLSTKFGKKKLQL